MSYTREQIQDYRAALIAELGEKFQGMGVRLKTVDGPETAKLRITTRWDFDNEVETKIEAIGKNLLGIDFDPIKYIDYEVEKKELIRSRDR